MAAAFVLLATVAGVYLWQHGQVRDRQSDLNQSRQQLTTTQQEFTRTQQQLTSTLGRLTATQHRAGALRAEASGLHQQVLRLLDNLAAVSAARNGLAAQLSNVRAGNSELVARLQAVSARRDRLASRLEATRRQLTEVQARLQAAESRLLTLTGPALADGHYVGKLFAVANTAPQRLPIRVFATIKGDSTAQPGWRVLEVAPDTKVRLTTLRGVGPRTMTFAWFAHVFNSGVPQNASVHGTQYSVTLESGLLTAIGEHRVT